MILMIFDPRAGKRIPIEVASPPKDERPVRPMWSSPFVSGDGPEHRQEHQHDHHEDQHETEHAAAAKMLPRETFQDHGALDP